VSGPPTDHIAIGIVRRGDEVLLVEQQGPDDPTAYWVLPGGLVEPGESLSEALVREVREESGVQVSAIGRLAYVTNIILPAGQALAFVFEVAGWQGDLGHADPDGEIIGVAFAPLAVALERLRGITWAGMREPLLAYLGGSVAAGAVWIYRQEGGDPGEQRLVQRM